jgi:intein/homing endonuclease
MKFTLILLEKLFSYGSEVCGASEELLKILSNYSNKDFPEFSTRIFYYWRLGKKPLPLSVIVRLMEDKKISSVDIDYFSIRGGNKIFLPNENDPSFSYFLGLILGDGCLVQTKRGELKSSCRIQISFRTKEEAQRIAILCESFFDLPCSIYNGKGCFDLCVFSKPLVLIMSHRYEIPLGKKYYKIQIPQIIFRGKTSNKIAFLKGVFDSDGNIYIHRNRLSIQLRQKSEKFLRQLKSLFSEVGIEFNPPYYDKANDSWVLWSSKKELVDTFINKIVGFKFEAPVAQPG